MRAVRSLSQPGGAEHFLKMGTGVATELRRRNLRGFPFFVLYGVLGDRLLFGALFPAVRSADVARGLWRNGWLALKATDNRRVRPSNERR